MLQVHLIRDTGVLYGLCVPPFDLQDIFDAAQHLSEESWPGMTLACPAVLDARLVRLTELQNADLGSFLLKRPNLRPPYGAGPLAMVAGDLGSYGMLRMFGILGDVAGIRPESQSFVTESMPGALGWIRDRSGLETVALEDLESGIADLQRRFLPAGPMPLE